MPTQAWGPNLVTGFEPVTVGSEDRCSTELSHTKGLTAIGNTVGTDQFDVVRDLPLIHATMVWRSRRDSNSHLGYRSLCYVDLPARLCVSVWSKSFRCDLTCRCLFQLGYPGMWSPELGSNLHLCGGS